MSTPPTMRKRPAADPPSAANDPYPHPVRRPPLAERLPGMSDERLVSLQQAATRIVQDAEHPKHATATIALPMIDAEIGRRAANLAGSKDQRSNGDNAGD